MVFVFFIYGLAFFILGFAILLYPRRNSRFALAGQVNLIAGFGVIHGINEWIDMFILLNKPAPVAVLEIARLFTLPVSFIFLLFFGVRIIAINKKIYSSLKWLPPALLFIWVILLIAGRHNAFLTTDVLSRYLFCFPGAFLTAYALSMNYPEFKKTELIGVIRNIRLAAAAFFCYSILAGLIVPRADFFPASVVNYEAFKAVIGLPVQILRAICAVITAYSMIRVLSIFNWEAQQALRDTEQQRMQTHMELDKYRDELIKTKHLASLGTMSATMAQELGKPIAVARVLLERVISNISKKPENDNVSKWLKGGWDEISKAAASIEDFYTAADITPKPRAEPVDIYQIVQRIIAVFSDSADKAKLKLLAADMDIVPHIRMSSRELEQIFFIMIQNAIETTDGKRMHELKMSCREEDGRILLTFADDCGGIAAEKVQRIFEPLSMLKSGGRDMSFGLAIVKRIVTAYYGDIRVDSEPGKGTTFFITLPVE